LLGAFIAWSVEREVSLCQVVYALHRNEVLHAVLTIKVAHLPSQQFRQQDGVNCTVKIFYLTITTKFAPTQQSSAVSGLRTLTLFFPRRP